MSTTADRSRKTERRAWRAFDARLAAEVRLMAADLRTKAERATRSRERSETPVPRVMVMTDATDGQPPRALMDEFVDPVHLETEHSAEAFMERLGWAIVDAGKEEPAPSN